MSARKVEVFRVVVTHTPSIPRNVTEFWLRYPDATEFFWPSAKHLYRSRSGAVGRARLIRDYGATVHVERAVEITWAEVPG